MNQPTVCLCKSNYRLLSILFVFPTFWGKKVCVVSSTHPEGSDASALMGITYIQQGWGSSASQLHLNTTFVTLVVLQEYTTASALKSPTETRMNAIMNVVICCCFIGANFANPITVNIDLDLVEQQTNLTETLLVAQSSGNGTTDVQSSESESSESVESESSDETSEESDSIESNETELLVETRDDSMGSEENIRKSWVRVFATVVRDTSSEDNSTEVKIQPEILNNNLTEKQTIKPPTVKTLKQSNAKVALVQKVTADSDSSSESAESTALLTVTVDSSQSSSSESNETSSEASDSDSASNSEQSSESSEEDSDSDSRELSPFKDCVNGTQSCESEEYFFQDIGDDANYSVDTMMVPDEDDRELSLRR